MQEDAKIYVEKCVCPYLEILSDCDTYTEEIEKKYPEGKGRNEMIELIRKLSEDCN